MESHAEVEGSVHLHAKFCNHNIHVFYHLKQAWYSGFPIGEKKKGFFPFNFCSRRAVGFFWLETGVKTNLSASALKD